MSIRVLLRGDPSFIAYSMVIADTCEPLSNKILIGRYFPVISHIRTTTVAKTTRMSACVVPEKLGDEDRFSFVPAVEFVTFPPEFEVSWWFTATLLLSTCNNVLCRPSHVRHAYVDLHAVAR